MFKVNELGCIHCKKVHYLTVFSLAIFMSIYSSRERTGRKCKKVKLSTPLVCCLSCFSFYTPIFPTFPPALELSHKCWSAITPADVRRRWQTRDSSVSHHTLSGYFSLCRCSTNHILPMSPENEFSVFLVWAFTDAQSDEQWPL